MSKGSRHRHEATNNVVNLFKGSRHPLIKTTAPHPGAILHPAHRPQEAAVVLAEEAVAAAVAVVVAAGAGKTC